MPPSSLNVLVVEDHGDTLEVLGRFLRDLGCRCRLVASAGCALSAATVESFDLLITDVRLGGRDGWTLIRDLRAQGCLPPLVASVNAGPNDTQTARSKVEGCNWHLIKPFRWNELRIGSLGASSLQKERNALLCL